MKTEAADGDPSCAIRLQQAMASALNLDGYVDEVRALAKALLAVHAIPETEPTDALHIATATIYQLDVLLTWNCKHMANLVTLPKTAAIVTKAGYECPVIITPDEFLAKKEAFGL